VIMVLEKDAYVQQHALTNAWTLLVGSEICADVQAGLDREWLVTNGLGGYAAGSILGATTRCYHGLLVAALNPPVARTVLVAKIDEEVTLPDGKVIQLGVNEYLGGTINPQGYLYLQTVHLDGDIIYFLYRLSDTLSLEKRVWMEYGQNTTYVQYTLHETPVGTGRGSVGAGRGLLEHGQGLLEHGQGQALSLRAPVTLKLLPFCLSRDYHATTRGSEDWHFFVDDQKSRCRVRAYDGAPDYHLIADPSAIFTSTGDAEGPALWYWHIWHRRDHERGLSDQEDVCVPGFFQLSLVPEVTKTLVLSAEADLPSEIGSLSHEEAVALALMRHQRRTQQILAVADGYADDLHVCDPVHARLVLAADQFIVARPDYAGQAEDTGKVQGTGLVQETGSAQGTGSALGTIPTGALLPLVPDRKTIIAGYPWFTDWGRDSMISLPGLLLCTGRYSEARGLLKAFASFVHNGLIPNRFPDGGEPPVYNAADATLWMFHAIDRYIGATNDWALLKELFPILSEIIQWHIRATDYGISVDPQDGLLWVGAGPTLANVPDVQLTWMDAKVDDWIVTPRRGKPVEVNALWYNALTVMEAWAVHLFIDATDYSQLRSLVREHFSSRFWYQEGGYLYDVVDVDGTSGYNDAALRPNQLFAASLTRDLLSEEQVASLFRKVTDDLLTPFGLRTLSPSDPNYRNHFQGNVRERDSAYHQGTVWPWLIGAYIDVHLHVCNNRAALKPLLLPLAWQLWEGCLGTIGEVAEPEPPFTSGGCFAQAWSIAEVLRCWLLAT
jgi:glycogen debranching enzyme